MFSTEVYFDFGKHDLRSKTDSLLLNLRDYVKGKDNFTIRITAHTDSIGSLANNLALSQRRAQSIKDFLVKNSIDAARISFAYFGEKKPVTDNRTEEGRQQNRRATVEVLLTLPIVIIEGVVTDEKTFQPLTAEVIIRTKEGSDTLLTGADGRFRTEQLSGTVVGIDAYAKCHFMRTEMVKAMPKMSAVNLPLRPANTGAIADIGNLYFVGNQPVLLESSKPELPKILRFLQDNPDMKIEIAGHVNRPNNPPVLKSSWDFKLSEDRAKTVYNYLIENGITAERVSWKGYGNHEMRFPKAIYEKEQALNRRVEMRVLEGGCE
ncbi:MAG: OmpA family protein [Saprospiraceae bacterium]|nr:OmpA family protein [Saprospiraceae bacterium]MCF8248848.1 OmpA family protein [Saprospiraceae bacterium]MCF8279573.1 OmpA family protein [Bacteroidales bacterium]MCF8310133.1 OmpA family protein [Saprospiraceae bacterium]MCF8439033.1 OmpA family protein [Saprospiraceae bacterium]